MSAIVIGMSAYLIVTAVMAVIILAGLSLLAWLLGAVPTQLPGSWSSQKEGERILLLPGLAQRS